MTVFDPALETARYIDNLGIEALEKAAAYTVGSHWLLLGGLLVSMLVTWIIVRLGLLEPLSAKLNRRRIRFLGVDWGWGALLSCALFGVAHAFGYADGTFRFDPMIMALTAIPSFIAVWLRLRTGSALLPILLHNLGNSMSFIMGKPA